MLHNDTLKKQFEDAKIFSFKVNTSKISRAEVIISESKQKHY